MNRRLLAPLLLSLGLLPTVFAIHQADTHAQTRRLSAREKVLAKIPNDPSVLINVTAREMPASPDIINLGKRSTKALERCLSDNVDAYIRSSCAVILEALGDRSALPTLHVALEDWEPGVRRQVIYALAAMPDPSSVEPLIKLFNRKDEDPSTKSAIFSAFARISDKRVVRLLRDELRKKNDDSDWRSSAFDALWSNRHMMARNTLIADTRHALSSDDNNGLVLSATLAAAELRSPRLVPALTPLLEHQWDEIRNKAVYALGRIGDRKATKVLLARLPEVRDARMLNNISFALERLDKKAFYDSIGTVAKHKQAVIRLNAAFVLGDVKHPDGLPLLLEALDDPSDYVRTSAIVAVGKIGSTDGLKALERFVDHPNISVRQEAIYAIDASTPNGRPDLVYDKLFKLRRDKHPHIVRRAAVQLAKRADPRVRDYMLGCFESYGCSADAITPVLTKQGDANAAGRVMYAWAQGRYGATELVSALRPTGTRELATAALERHWSSPFSPATRSSMWLLADLGDKSAAPLLQKRANTKHFWVRMRATVALTRLGDEEARARLLSELDGMPVEWLSRYARLLQSIEEADVRAALDPELAKRESASEIHVALAMASVRLRWNPEKAFFRFLEALASDRADERDLAEWYLDRNDDRTVTSLIRRALARETRESTRDRLRAILDTRN